jgi:hypothetical protein
MIIIFWIRHDQRFCDQKKHAHRMLQLSRIVFIDLHVAAAVLVIYCTVTWKTCCNWGSLFKKLIPPLVVFSFSSENTVELKGVFLSLFLPNASKQQVYLQVPVTLLYYPWISPSAQNPIVISDPKHQLEFPRKSFIYFRRNRNSDENLSNFVEISMFRFSKISILISLSKLEFRFRFTFDEIKIPTKFNIEFIKISIWKLKFLF